MENIKTLNQLETWRENLVSLPERKLNILVVEDDLSWEPVWAHIIEKVDASSNLEWATSVSDAEQKIAKARTKGKAFDLLISDIFLSGSKTGIDLWNQYRDLFAGKIILVSGVDQIKMEKYMKGSSRSPLYLKKPLVVHECIEAVFGLIHKK